MLMQPLNSPGRQGYRSRAPVRLRLPEDEPLTGEPLTRLAHGQPARVQVYIPPAQAEQFTLP